MWPFLIFLCAVLVCAFLLLFFVFPHAFLAVVDALLRRLAGLREETVTIDGTEWSYMIGGPEGAPIMVLVHGFGDRKEAWFGYTRALKGRYRIIAPDLPAFGKSDKRTDISHAPTAQAARLHGLLTQLGAARCHMAGNSMGGMITMEYALQFPADLQSMTLYDSAGASAEKLSELAEAIERGENPLMVESASDVDRLLAFSLYEPPKLPRPVKQVIFAGSRDNKAIRNKVFEEIVAEGAEGEFDKRLKKIKCPSLVVWGRHDRVIDVSCTKVYERELPDVRVVILEECGHMPMFEMPEVSAEMHAELVERAEAA